MIYFNAGIAEIAGRIGASTHSGQSRGPRDSLLCDPCVETLRVLRVLRGKTGPSAKQIHWELVAGNW